MMRSRHTLLLVAILLAGCEQAAPEAAPARSIDQAAPVVVAEVSEREFSQPIEAIGTARALESVLVTSRVSGRVRRIFFTQGTAVREGDRLVQLEDDEERADVETARANAAQAQNRYERLRTLSEQGLISKDELDAQSELRKSAEAELQLAQVLLEQRTIRAPFSGVLGFRQVSPGTLVQPGTAIVSLDATQQLRAEFQVPETLLAGVQRGTTVFVEAAAYPGIDFKGEVETVGTRIDETTRAVTVQALIDNPEQRLKPGMLLTITAQARQRRAPFLPESALVPENADQYVWLIGSDDQVSRKRVDIGARIPGYVEVQSGLALGDRVVVEGQANLRPGRIVRIVSRPGTSHLAEG